MDVIESHKLEMRSFHSSRELLRVQILGLKNTLVLGICYWPPDQNAEDDFEVEKEVMEAAKGKSTVIMDVFTYLYTDWASSCLGHVEETTFLDMLNECTRTPIGHGTDN